jgi:hypothetical protein
LSATVIVITACRSTTWSAHELKLLRTQKSGFSKITVTAAIVLAKVLDEQKLARRERQYLGTPLITG